MCHEGNGHRIVISPECLKQMMDNLTTDPLRPRPTRREDDRASCWLGSWSDAIRARLSGWDLNLSILNQWEFVLANTHRHSCFPHW
ncbi:hypothetical protein EVAR_29049_1 [Eumeta japonica]|uniref:Uncharacterized protein n=1 Tax=Eumeta variegata TaxID=151549 RepID=A0A4C1W2K5_EUMVA|nr:hypothetical protein EVAR_29049_1 [Eumeta japonica]